MSPPRDPSRSAPAADVWLGLIFASLLGEFVAAAYFPSLQAISVHWSAALFVLLASPALLVWPPLRAAAGKAPLLGAIGLLGSLAPLPVVRAMLLGLGLAGVATGLVAAALVRPREVATPWIGGIVLAWGLRALGGSFDPLYSAAWTVIGAALVTAMAARHFRVGREESAGTAQGRPRDGLAFGALLFIVHGWFLGPTVLPRWAALDPIWQATVAIALALGFSVRAPWFIAVIGMGLLALARGAPAMAGGLILAVALPSAWCAGVTRLGRGGPGAVPVAAAVYLTLLTAQGLVFAADYVLDWTVYRLALVSISLTAAALGACHVRSWSLRPCVLPAVVGLIAGLLLWRSGVAPSPDFGARAEIALTWNLQQGFDQSGRPNVRSVAAVARSEGATILGLVETDATRPLSGGRDPVAWLAAELQMHAVSGPDPREATFGLAVLSVHPIRSSEILMQPSGGDPVAVLLATLDLEGIPIQVAVAHLGGPDRHRDFQARAVAGALSKTDGPLILLGDFNAEPGSGPMETIGSAGFALAYIGRASTVFGGQFDHILTRGLSAGPSRVVDTGPVSDHPPVVTPILIR